jgi:hypothetical protein
MATRIVLAMFTAESSVWIQGLGDDLGTDHAETVAVVLVPEFGTVAAEFIRDVAKEAANVADLLGSLRLRLRNPAGRRGATTVASLTLLHAHIIPDVAIGDELLKTACSGKLS